MLVALVVLGVPPILTNAYVAVDEVEPDAVEAARGMGMTPLQVLRRVELPLALPLLFAGIRTAAVFIVATATIAAIAGGGGLGEILVNQATLRRRRAGRRGALRVAARARGRRRLGGRAARADPARTETPGSGVRTGCAPGRLTG